MGGREVSIERDYPVVDGLKFDATDDRDGRPWDVKGSMTNGVRPTFKFWMDRTVYLNMMVAMYWFATVSGNRN